MMLLKTRMIMRLRTVLRPRLRLMSTEPLLSLTNSRNSQMKPEPCQPLSNPERAQAQANGESLVTMKTVTTKKQWRLRKALLTKLLKKH
jgi:hypothetical protein